MLLGAHCSISGGLENACKEAGQLNMNCLQIFTKNQRQWREKEIKPDEAETFKLEMKRNKILVAYSHTTYLINLAAADIEIREKSIISLAAELIRCDVLDIPYAVLHPGSNRDISPKDAIKRIAEGLKMVFSHTRELKSSILLENTAGQGSSIGRNFEQINEIIELTEEDSIGMCFDTCHAFAAGYPIHTQEGFDTTFEEIDKTVGLHRLKGFHLNDSKGSLGSRLDRHEGIGKGQIGLLPFQNIMKNFSDTPKFIETPKENDMDKVNLQIIRGLT
ncbi:MAG: deoxyribonuclease IV [Cytophagaceae bacterium]